MDIKINWKKKKEKKRKNEKKGVIVGIKMTRNNRIWLTLIFFKVTIWELKW